MKRYLFFLFLLTLGLQADAQKYEVGGWVGTSMYFGDLNPHFGFKSPGLAGGLIGRINFNPRVSIKGGLNYFRLSADDADSDFPWQQARNLSFKSGVLDGTVQLEFNFLEYIHGDPNAYYTPYIFGGMSMYHFNPKAVLNGETVALQPLGTEGQARNSEYTRTQLAFAYGGGFKFDLNASWSVNVELSARLLFTDYLDDVSGEYPDFDDLEDRRGELAPLLSDRSGEINEFPVGEPGRQRGDTRGRDHITTFGIGLVYNFASVKCPAFYR